MNILSHRAFLFGFGPAKREPETGFFSDFRTLFVLVTVLGFHSPLPLKAETSLFLQGRVGIGAESHADATLAQVEGDVLGLVSLGSREGVTFDFTLAASAGGLWEGEKRSLILGVSPTVRIQYKKLPVFLVGSTGPAFLSQSRLSDIDLGSRIEFLSSLGFEWEFAENWRLGYRFAHLSNAGISNKNPGLNFHLFSIGAGI